MMILSEKGFERYKVGKISVFPTFPKNVHFQARKSSDPTSHIIPKVGPQSDHFFSLKLTNTNNHVQKMFGACLRFLKTRNNKKRGNLACYFGIHHPPPPSPHTPQVFCIISSSAPTKSTTAVPTVIFVFDWNNAVIVKRAK
jgi:hypothetical protein